MKAIRALYLLLFALIAADAAVTRQVVVPAGTAVRIRLDQTLDTRHTRPGDIVAATVSSSIVENGVRVIPAGARAYCRVVDSESSGRFRGRAVLAFRLEQIDLRGRRYSVRTPVQTRVTSGHKNRNLAWIGGGAGYGAAIGAIAAGGPGALIGAGAGAVAGTATAAITGRKQLRVPVETPVTFRLAAPLPIRI